tara:strand:+ start:400 stop:723 length:324 start_codon:yes stop_codon:yes gene_type:complete
MDYRLIKENFDKATAELEEAEPGAPAFAVGDKVKFSYGSMSRTKNRARGTVTGVEPAEHKRQHPDGLPRGAYIVTVEWDNYQPLASGGEQRTNIGKYYDDELAPATD